jgi:hypothetical protein
MWDVVELCGNSNLVDLHHKMGRGKHINDDRYFMTVCRHHHQWIENYKRQARKLGYILY